MVYMLEKKFANNELEIELTSYIDNKQNIWLRVKTLPWSLATKMRMQTKF